MSKLKVGLFLDAFFPAYDGVINYVDNLARGLGDKCEITLFCPGMEPEAYYQKFPYQIVRCKCRKVIGIHYLVPTPRNDHQFLKTLQQSRFDLVHVHSPFSVGKLGYKYALQRNIPIITTFHTQFKQDFYHHTKSIILTKILLKNVTHWIDKSDEVWTNNQAMIDLLTNEYKSKAKKVLMFNFTNHCPLKYTEKGKIRQDFNTKYKIYNRTKLLLFVGRLTKLKNTFFLLKVAKILKHMNFSFKLIFAGDGADEKKLRAKVKTNKLENSVIFLGRIDQTELEKMYAIADLLVFPSKYDASSLVQIEAAMQFLPTLFLKDTITASTIENNLTGFTCSDHPRDYALRIMGILQSKKLYLNVKEHCHLIARSWEQMEDQIYNRYLEVIKNHSK